jgi:hypothetical protein
MAKENDQARETNILDSINEGISYKREKSKQAGETHILESIGTSWGQ